MEYTVSNRATYTNKVIEGGIDYSESKFELSIEGINDKFIIVYDVRYSNRKNDQNYYSIYLDDDTCRYVHEYMYSKETYDKIHKLVATLVKSFIETKPL